MQHQGLAYSQYPVLALVLLKANHICFFITNYKDLKIKAQVLLQTKYKQGKITSGWVIENTGL